MTKILNITSNPQTFTGGTYAAAASIINTKKWQVTVVPTAASSTFAPGTFHVIFGQNNGGLAFNGPTIEMDDSASDAMMFQQSLTWSAGQTLTFTVDTRSATRSVTIAGATTGNGTFTYTSGNAVIAAGTNLEIGNVGGAATFAGTISPIDDLTPDESWLPVLPTQSLRRSPGFGTGAMLMAAMTAPVMTIANPPAPAMSWSSVTPDYSLHTSPHVVNFGGATAPEISQPNADSPLLAWGPEFPDVVARARQDVNVGGSSQPDATLPNPPAPAMSWSPEFPDILSRAKSSVLIGGSAQPEATLPNLLPPGLGWSPVFPDVVMRPRQTHHVSMVAPPFAGGARLTTGGMRVRQNILNQLTFSTPLTTFGTDITFTAAAGTVLTATAHAMINCAGPFTLQTTGTLPGGTNGTTLYYCAQPTANTFHLATSAANADTSTFVTMTDGGTGVHTLVRHVDTAPLYSTFVSIISRGNQAASPNLPTDNKGNTYAYVAGTPSLFTGFPASAFSVAVVFGGIGGNQHTWSTSIGNVGGNQDEVLASGLEIFDAHLLQDSSNIEQPDGGLAIITSNPVTTTARALLIAIIGGNSNVNQENFWIFFDGFTKLPYVSAEGDPDPAGYDQVCVAYKYVEIAQKNITFRAQGTVRSGGGPSGGKMILLAFQAQASDLSPLDWLYQQADPPHVHRRGQTAGESSPPSQLGSPVPSSAWLSQTGDVFSGRRLSQGGELAPPHGQTAGNLLSWISTHQQPLAIPRRVFSGDETSPPPAQVAANLLSWFGVLPQTTPRHVAILGGETSPPSDTNAGPLTWCSFYAGVSATRRGVVASGETSPPVQTQSSPAPPLSWDAQRIDVSRIRSTSTLSQSSTQPDLALSITPPAIAWTQSQSSLASRPRVTVGGATQPEATLPDILVLQTSTDTVRTRLRTVLNVGGTTQPEISLPNTPATPLSWRAVVPDLVYRARSVVIVGGASQPESTIPNPPAPTLSWSPESPDLTIVLRRLSSGGFFSPEFVPTSVPPTPTPTGPAMEQPSTVSVTTLSPVCDVVSRVSIPAVILRANIDEGHTSVDESSLSPTFSDGSPTTDVEAGNVHNDND